MLLRIASVLTLIHAVLHTIGGVFGEVEPGPATVAVQAMKRNEFLLMGHARTYWDFYRGMGLGVTIFLAAEAILFWQLGTLAKTDAGRLRPILYTFSIAYVVLAVNSNAYFFVAPVITEIFIAACLAMTIVGAKSQPGADAGTRQRA
ncbi:MAG TPA: hypothetical protein VNH18_22300 [Bryobacteraceae bacterium]|nr:hypothetical protein [Bryobacteraceae bacterium]